MTDGECRDVAYKSDVTEAIFKLGVMHRDLSIHIERVCACRPGQAMHARDIQFHISAP